MAKILEQRGFFWWFDRPDGPAHSKETSVPALLTVSDEGQITLDADGSLCGNDEYRDWTKPRLLPATRKIVGQLASPGEYVLLEGLERTDLALADESPQQQTFTAELCIRRDSPFPNNYSQEEFLELRVEMTGLEDWLELDSILVGDEHTRDAEVQVQVSYREHRLSYPTPVGTISIESITTGADLFGYFSTHPRRDIHFKQTYYLVFRPETPRTLSALRDTYTRLEEFIALLTGFYERLSWPILIHKEEPFDSWETVHFYRGSPSAQSINRHFFWVPFARISEVFGALFRGWQIGSDAFGAGYYLYVSSLRNPHIYSEHRFANLVWSVEALHRKWLSEPETSDRVVKEKERVERILNSLPEGNEDRKWLGKKLRYAHELPLEARILKCFRELPFTFGKSQLEKFAKACADRRNDISHQGGPREGTDYASFYEETNQLAEALDHLFHALLLHQIGVAPKVLSETMTTSWVSEMRIKPALFAVGLEIQTATPLDDTRPQTQKGG
jgi:hypothetical protein